MRAHIHFSDAGIDAIHVHHNRDKESADFDLRATFYSGKPQDHDWFGLVVDGVTHYLSTDQFQKLMESMVDAEQKRVDLAEEETGSHPRDLSMADELAEVGMSQADFL